MKNSYEQPSIREEVFNLDFDLKAETFTAQLDQKGLALDLNLADYFKRRFSKDITDIFDNEETEKLEVRLSRRCFYNIFPERFFHTSYSSTPYVQNMVADYKNRKLEEQEARKFFKPLEEEFFMNRVAVEKEEQKILESLGSADLVEFLKDLWSIDPKIPDAMAAKILKTMPFIYKIAGNLPLLQKILENIIGETVYIERGYLSISHKTTKEPLQLGVNMATSGQPQSFLPKYTFYVQNISKPEAIEDYLPNGKMISVITYFLEHTLPFESDYDIKFTVSDLKTKFLLNEQPYSGRLGISATI